MLQLLKKIEIRFELTFHPSNFDYSEKTGFKKVFLCEWVLISVSFIFKEEIIRLLRVQK